MTPRVRVALRGVVIALGLGVTLWGALAMRVADWPIYVTYVALAIVLHGPAVEVVPGMSLPMPGLALTLGFLYVGGLPIVLLRNAAPPNLMQLMRLVLPDRWRPRRVWGYGTLFTGYGSLDHVPRPAAGADWAYFNIGLAVRWWIASTLVPAGSVAGHPGAILCAEAGGYACWAALSMLPLLSFESVLPAHGHARHRALMGDLGLITVLGLTPFVFLITSGYQTNGLAGAAVWSLSALGLHFILQRLNERRVVVEEQNRRLEALNRELEHRERLSAIGKMSSVVSHQMLQQLGIMRLHADLIRHAEPDDDALARAKANAARIEEALDGVDRVLTDLLVFSRDLRLNLYEHPLDRVLAECVEECRTEALARGVALHLQCPPDLRVSIDKLKMKQAIANVVRNAIEASPSNGAVRIAGAQHDGWIEVAVSDDGPGVPAPARDAIFTPFFTTKEQGTGLGLAIAREFVDAHGGRIALEDGAGRGARFVLRLPALPP